jgi:formate hydrogenlyase subunit 3/multisubunit Na+/H+ antiporter MnhD subunit
MKITLFFCAGNLAETLGVHQIDEVKGIGRRMPLTMGAFTIAAFGMIGAPPVAGFISKWYLGAGGLAADDAWVLGVLAISTVLNAAYFLPIVYAAWFREPDQPWEEKIARGRLETSWMLLVPCVVTALASLLAGVLAGAPFSPLGLATEIAEELYGLWP